MFLSVPLSFIFISIHAPRAGSDSISISFCVARRHFNPRSPCGERLIPSRRFWRRRAISIHAPRAGSDQTALTNWARMIHFNPRSPCGERPDCVPRHLDRVRFQSTLPVRGATLLECLKVTWHTQFQSTLPVRGATLILFAANQVCYIFQSTLPVRGATRSNLVGSRFWTISIHAPRAGSDRSMPLSRMTCRYFNPRSPCGERLLGFLLLITSPKNFNPRSPCGERHFKNVFPGPVW